MQASVRRGALATPLLPAPKGPVTGAGDLAQSPLPRAAAAGRCREQQGRTQQEQQGVAPPRCPCPAETRAPARGGCSLDGIHAWNPCMDGAWMHGCSIRVLARRAPAGPAALAARTEKRRDGSPPQPRRLRLRSNAGNRVCKVSERRRWKPVLNNHYDTKENTKKSSNTLKPIWALHEQLFHLLQSRHAIVLLSPRTPGPGPTNPLQNPVERPVVVERLFGPLGIARRDQE